jgi:hypothetical protein
MSVRRNQVIVDPAIPPLLVQIINAARHAAKASTDRAGHDKVLADLSRWALVHVPNGGVLAPESDQAYQVIEQAAERHLGVKDARAALRATISRRLRTGFRQSETARITTPVLRAALPWLSWRQFDDGHDARGVHGGLARGRTCDVLEMLGADVRPLHPRTPGI